MSRPGINQQLVVNTQTTTIVGSKTKSITTGDSRSQLSRPTNGKRRFRKKRIGRLIGRLKINPTFFTYFRRTLQCSVFKIFRFQSFRKVFSLNQFQAIGSRFPGCIHYFHSIACPVFYTLQNGNRIYYRRTAIIAKLTFTGIDTYHGY